MFWKRKSKSVPAERNSFAIPAGQRVYAIGDIHGRDDLFAELIGLIRADNAARGPARVTLILLGDLVDRGPQSAEVVERAIHLRDEFEDRSEEHTSELQSLMRISYAVFCLKKKKKTENT